MSTVRIVAETKQLNSSNGVALSVVSAAAFRNMAFNSTNVEMYPYVFKYIIIGDMGVGKSCMLKQFTEKKFMRDCPHTVGVEFGTRVIEFGGNKCKLQIWDTAGQERFRAVTRSYYRGAAGAILVYDVTRRSTFNHIADWLADARTLTSPNTVMLLVGNKVDMEAERDVTYEEGKSFADENRMAFLECSAKTGDNIEDVFVDTGKTIFEKVRDGCNELNSIEGPSAIETEATVRTQNQSRSCAC